MSRRKESNFIGKKFMGKDNIMVMRENSEVVEQ